MLCACESVDMLCACESFDMLCAMSRLTCCVHVSRLTCCVHVMCCGHVRVTCCMLSCCWSVNGSWGDPDNLLLNEKILYSI